MGESSPTSQKVPGIESGRSAGQTIGEVAKRSNATDCKSVAPVASKVRILPSPPEREGNFRFGLRE
jgi:hypothetical protein